MPKSENMFAANEDLNCQGQRQCCYVASVDL